VKQILTEFIAFEYDAGVVTEAVSRGDGTVRIKSILQRANAKNQNGRIYPKELLHREAQKYQQEFVAQRRAMGELDHPESTVVNLKNVSHTVVEMHWEGDDLVGMLEILDTPCGKIVKDLMRANVRLGVSSRGVGSVVNAGKDTVSVDEDFSLICFDIVSNPSTQGAFLNESMQHAIARAKTDRINNLITDFFTEIG
jgi:Kyanoviridae head maturation protease